MKIKIDEKYIAALSLYNIYDFKLTFKGENTTTQEVTDEFYNNTTLDQLTNLVKHMTTKTKKWHKVYKWYFENYVKECKELKEGVYEVK